MGLKFNPFSGNFDFTGSGGGGGSSYIDGEEATYNDLSLDAGVAPLNSAWLVRNSSGIWPFNKPGGIYIRTATLGVSRDADYTYAGTMPDVFSDAVLTIYDEASTTRTGQFNLGSVTAGQNRVLTWPDANGTIARTETFAAPPAIGNTTPAAGTFTTLTANTSLTLNGTGAAELVNAAAAAGPLRIYNTFTSATNHERGFLRWSSNVFQIGTEKGSAGGTAKALEFQTDGVTRMTIQTGGTIATSGVLNVGSTLTVGGAGNIQLPSSQLLFWLNRGVLGSPADGQILLQNNAGTDFNRLHFGGTTSSFPALKRNTTSLQVKLADDSAFTAIQGKLTTETAYTAGAPTATGYLVLYDSNGTAYKVPAEAL
jgi:hypothetical protein